jgi:pimeloyl-ACP methyl ester carboxylesterase
MEELKEDHRYGEDQIRAIYTQFHNFKDSYRDMNFTPPYLSTITTRTLIVHGDRDRFFPVKIPVEMYLSIPNAYLWIIPNEDHFPIGGNNANIFTEKALEFFTGDWEKN